MTENNFHLHRIIIYPFRAPCVKTYQSIWIRKYFTKINLTLHSWSLQHCIHRNIKRKSYDFIQHLLCIDVCTQNIWRNIQVVHFRYNFTYRYTKMTKNCSFNSNPNQQKTLIHSTEL